MPCAPRYQAGDAIDLDRLNRDLAAMREELRPD